MSRANSPAAPQGNNANQQVAGNIEGPMRRPRDENVPPPAAAAAAQPPQIRQRTEEGPNWTMDSSIEDVLLQRYAGLRDMTVNDFIQKFVGGTFAVAEAENVRMPIFVKNPRKYIVDAEILEDIQGTNEFKTVKAAIYLSEKVDYLDEKEISTLSQWEEKGKGEIREFVGPVARGRLDGALAAAKRAEKRAVLAAGGAVNLEGVYESIYNAKWCHIIIDNGTQPLGMRLVDGMPNEGLMWKDEEVNVVPEIEEALEQKPERTKGVELLVLTSEMGWPYTGFARGSNSDIFIRREELRVWNVVRNGIELWRTQRALPECPYLPRSYVAIGNPGIGKSQNFGSFILYKLLHYDAEELPVVAYFCGVAAYIFEKSGGGGVGRVREYSKEAAITFMKNISSNTRGYIIYDFVNKGEQPPADVAPKWGSILISSPNLRNFDSWQKQRKGAFIVVNCWEMSEMRAFFSRMGLKLFPQPDRCGLRKRWSMYKDRVERVGPSLRYVFDEVMYEQQLTAVDGELESIVSGNKYGIYTKVLGNCGEWRDNDASHKLVKIVRIKAREGNSFDTYVCVAHSKSIKKRILNVVLSGIAEKWALTTGMARDASVIGLYFEKNAIKYLSSPKVLTCFVSLITKLPANERAGRTRTRKSILQHVRDGLLKVGRPDTVPSDINWAESKGAPVELYVPCVSNFPVADAFFIVDDKEAAQASGTTGKKTIVLLQFTVASSHHTTTDKFIHLLQSLLPTAEGGGHQNEATVEQLKEITEMFHWEIIYVQHFESTAMRSEQKCEITQGKAKHRSHQFVEGFWKNNVQQYRVQYEDNIVTKMLAEVVADGPGAANAGQANN